MSFNLFLALVLARKRSTKQKTRRNKRLKNRLKQKNISTPKRDSPWNAAVASKSHWNTTPRLSHAKVLALLVSAWGTAFHQTGFNLKHDTVLVLGSVQQ